MVTNVIVRKSGARGIAIVGQSDVNLSNFLIDSTKVSGVYVAYESSYNTRTPENVKISNGIVKYGGIISGGTGNRFGLEVSNAKSVYFANIKVDSAYTRGINVDAGNGSVIDLKNISVSNTVISDNVNLKAESVNIDGLISENSNNYGVFISQSENVFANNILTKNVSKTNVLHRAVWFENNTNVFSNNISVIDNQGTSTGYVVGEYNNSTGYIGRVKQKIDNGTFAYVNSSAGVTFEEISYNTSLSTLQSNINAKLSTATAASTYVTIANNLENITGSKNFTNTATFTAASPIVIRSGSYFPIVSHRTINIPGNGQQFYFRFNNSANAEIDYAAIGASIETNTAGSEGGTIDFVTKYAGTLAQRAKFTPNGTLLIGGSTASNSALLDLQSTTKGVLFPRMTTTERGLITVVEGLIIYNLTTHQLEFYNGTSWTAL